MKMIEKVARAICQADEQNGGAPWDFYATDKARSGYYDSARAALTALLEPNEAMLDAGALMTDEDLYIGNTRARGVIWAAIQAALDESQP